MLDAAPDIEVVGELEDIIDMSAVVSELRPDVILLDLELEKTNGIETLLMAMRSLRETAPDTRVIIYTSHDEEERIIQAVKLGVDGYLLKGCRREKMVSAIRSVYNGGTALGESVASKLMHHMHTGSSGSKQPAIQLSKREQQVLELLAEGDTNSAIGAKLFISESTVKFHVHALLSKLDASNRTQAVAIAEHRGMIDRRQP